MSHALAWAAGGTGFTFLMTTLGAAMVFFFRKAVSANIQRIFLGFAAGVMIAASGLAFALAAQHNDSSAYAAAMALAIGMGIQNFPEGAAISLPLRQEGMSRGKSFVYGMLSGIVEPIFGVLVMLAAGGIQPLMPWLLSFAAGAMMYVVVEELIPEAHLGEHSNVGTLGVMGGFLLMMVLDVALG